MNLAHEPFYISMWESGFIDVNLEQNISSIAAGPGREELVVRFERTWEKSSLLGPSYSDFPCNSRCVAFHWASEEIVGFCLFVKMVHAFLKFLFFIEM